MDSIEQMKLLEEKLDKGFDDAWWSKDGVNWKRWKDVSSEEYAFAVICRGQEFWYTGKDNPNNGDKRDTTMSNYYTPTIEEFHIGFKCEYNQGSVRFPENGTLSDPEYDWVETVCDADDIGIALSHWEHQDYEGEFADTFRVKHLDREDIEELGWRLTKDYVVEQYYQKWIDAEKNIWLELSIDDKLEYPPLVTIEEWWDNEGGGGSSYETLFEGKVKNYNQLQQIMEMLNITGDEK